MTSASKTSQVTVAGPGPTRRYDSCADCGVQLKVVCRRRSRWWLGLMLNWSAKNTQWLTHVSPWPQQWQVHIRCVYLPIGHTSQARSALKPASEIATVLSCIQNTCSLWSAAAHTHVLGISSHAYNLDPASEQPETAWQILEKA